MPSIDQLVTVYGKRVLLMSASDYGSDMSWLAFDHHSPCDFTEPVFRCSARAAGGGHPTAEDSSPTG